MLAILTNSHDVHADYLGKKLIDRGTPFVRINTERILEESLSVEFMPGRFHPRVTGRLFELAAKATCFWYRRPRPIDTKYSDVHATRFRDDETQALLSGLWDLFDDAFWVSPPAALVRGSRKILQLHAAERIGFEIPRTLISTSPAEVRAFYEACERDIVTKALSLSWFEKNDRISIIRTRGISESDMQRADNIRLCPTLFQERIPKRSEVRVTIVGNKVFACEIHSQYQENTALDYKGNIASLRLEPFVLPEDVARNCLEMIESFGLHYGAIDLILTPEGQFVFLELNPNGQWLWIEERVGLPISDALIDLFRQKGDV